MQILKTAGYPQQVQVQQTVFSETDLLELDVTNVTRNDLIWIANKSNGDWDVRRLTSANTTIVQLESINDNTQMIVTFSGSHGLTAQTNRTEADYFAILNAQVLGLNRVFKVNSVIDHKTILVDFEGSEIVIYE